MLADETLISANGWGQFDPVKKDEQNQDHLNFCHSVAKTFSTPDGKKVLEGMVAKYLVNGSIHANDTQIGVGIKQGQANVVKSILAYIEKSNNA